MSGRDALRFTLSTSLVVLTLALLLGAKKKPLCPYNIVHEQRTHVAYATLPSYLDPPLAVRIKGEKYRRCQKEPPRHLSC